MIETIIVMPRLLILSLNSKSGHARNMQKGKERHGLRKKGEMSCNFGKIKKNVEEIRRLQVPKMAARLPQSWSLSRILSKSQDSVLGARQISAFCFLSLTLNITLFVMSSNRVHRTPLFLHRSSRMT
jgi:hypothetical protein